MSSEPDARPAAPPVVERPCLTAGLAGIGGRIKSAPEDFLVEEVPAVTPSGRGDHLWVLVEKRRLTTHEAAARLARHLRAAAGEVRLAGLKDRNAVTRQWFSIRGRAASDLAGLEAAAASAAPGSLAVLAAWRHTQPIRIGELRGNRFEVRIRGVAPDALERARPILAACAERGVPNFFGEQRFGRNGDNHLVIADLLRGDGRSALDRYLAGSMAAAGPAGAAARDLYAAGDFLGALQALPRRCDAERRCLRALADRKLEPAAALSRLPKPILWLLISAYQSWLFNRCLAARLETLGIDTLVPGDLCLDHRTEMISRVADDEPPAALASRARHFEASATGPIVGPAMVRPEGEPGRLEAAVLAEAGAAEDAGRIGRLFEDIEPAGTRRAVRFRIRDLDVREEPAVGPAGERALALRFRLDRGAYATTFLRELMKSPAGAIEDEAVETE